MAMSGRHRDDRGSILFYFQKFRISILYLLGVLLQSSLQSSRVMTVMMTVMHHASSVDTSIPSWQTSTRQTSSSDLGVDNEADIRCCLRLRIVSFNFSCKSGF